MSEEIALAESELNQNLVDAAGYMLKIDPVNTYPPFASNIMHLFAPIIIDAPTVLDNGALHNALCVFVDSFMYGTDQADILPRLIPALLVGLASKDDLLRQVGAFGLGVCAASPVASVNNEQWMVPVVDKLLEALKADDAEDPDMLNATENVVSALGKIGVALGYNERCMQPWLAGLPLVHDEMEAQWNHALLCRMILEDKIGGGGKSVQVLALCLKDKHMVVGGQSEVEELEDDDEEEFVEPIELIEPANKPLVVAALTRLSQRMGREAFLSAVSSVHDNEAKALVAQNVVLA